MKELFDKLKPVNPFTIKKIEISAHLAALLSYSGKSRSDLSNLTGWNENFINKLLNSARTLSMMSVWKFAKSLGYEMDIIFRLPEEAPAKQPWNFKLPEAPEPKSSRNESAIKETKRSHVNVVHLPVTVSYTPTDALEKAIKLNLEEVLIIGYDKDRVLRLRSSSMSLRDALWLVKAAEMNIFDIEE